MKKKYKKKPIFTKRPQKSLRAEGILTCAASGRCGFVSMPSGKGDIHIKSEYFGGANHGDRVLVSMSPAHHGRNPEGRVLKVLERAKKQMTAVVFADFGWGYVAKADDARFFSIINIPKKDGFDIKIGDRVAVIPTAFDSYGAPEADLIKNLGSSESTASRIDALVFTNGIKTEFDAETLIEAESIPSKISESEIASRLDLRNEKIITIDGDDSKDFDDAISIRKLPNGGYKLGVHIADVSYYVKTASHLDKEAYERGTSVYLPDRVYPMLPEKLSDNLCSLLPNEDRLAMSVIMNVSPSGNVTDYKIAKSVIRSMHRMTYSNVDKILNGDSALKKQYKDILATLSNMNALADILTEKRQRRGALDFDIPEMQAVLNGDGTVDKISLRERLKSHKIIEEFMLLANETIAKFAEENNLPIIYRTHAEPDGEKLKTLSLFLHNFGITLPEISAISQDALARVLKLAEPLPERSVIAKNMLRAMMKAEYKPQNDGHFGLAAEYYCHFTSPIRRYPDLFTHRVLSMALEKGNKFPKNAYDVSVQSTEKEQAAEACERDVDKLLAVLYMSAFIGESFDATISALTEFGIYAELENGIEGMIPLETIRGDYYIYNEKTLTTVGRRTGRSFKVGDSIQIVVSGTNPDLLRIDFMLKSDYYAKDERKRWNSK